MINYKSVNFEYFWFFSLSALLLALNYLLAVHSFPLSEGWWETYAYLEMRDVRLFKDIDIAFTPFFVYLNEFIISLFGIDFYSLRVFGVFIFFVLYALTFYFLRLFSSVWIASSSSFIAAILFMSSDPFIAKDYHTYLHVLVVLSLISFYFLLIKGSCAKDLIAAIFLALFVASAVLIKQNVGVLLFVSFLISLLFLKKYYSVLFVILLVSFFSYIIIPNDAWHSIGILFSENDSKGSLGRVLFAFLTGQNLVILVVSLLLIFSLFVSVLLFKGETSQLLSKFRKQFTFGSDFLSAYDRFFILSLIFIPFLIASFLILNSGMAIRVGFFVLMVSSLSLYFLFGLLKIIKPVLPLAFFFPLFILIYANTNTAYLDYNGQYENVAVFFALIISLLSNLFINKKYFKCIVLAFILVLFFSVTIKKYTSLYTWFIGGSYPYSDQKLTSNYTMLEGIKIDKKTLSVHQKIHSIVSAYSKGNDVYFMNLPSFYILENKIPPYRTVTQWFDVVTSQSIEEEYRLIKESSPRVAVLFFPEQAAVEAHAEMKRQESTFYQERILNFFILNAKNKTYNFEGCINYATKKSDYGNKDIYFDIYKSNFNIEVELNKFNANKDLDLSILDSKIYRRDSSPKPENVKEIKSLKSDYAVSGGGNDAVDFINSFGRVRNNGYQSVCFFVKND